MIPRALAVWPEMWLQWIVISLEWGKNKTKQAVPPPPWWSKLIFSLNEDTSVSVGLTSQTECLLSLSQAVEVLDGGELSGWNSAQRWGSWTKLFQADRGPCLCCSDDKAALLLLLQRSLLSSLNFQNWFFRCLSLWLALNCIWLALCYVQENLGTNASVWIFKLSFLVKVHRACSSRCRLCEVCVRIPLQSFPCGYKKIENLTSGNTSLGISTHCVSHYWEL